MTADNGIGLKRTQQDHQEVPEISAGLVKILYEPHEILALGGQLLGSSAKEILISISSANTFLRQSKLGILNKLFDILDSKKTKGGKIRILTPVNDLVSNVLEGMRKKYPDIEVKTTEEPDLQIQVTILVVDKESCLVIELKDDSRPIPEEAMGTAIYATSGPTVMSYFTIFETMWKQSELYAKLQAHEDAQREFINIAAHELRTPIQPILGLSEVLLIRDRSKDLALYHNIILRNARRLQKLAENILDVTKIEANAVKLKKEAVDLHSLISEVIEDFQHQIVADYLQVSEHEKEEGKAEGVEQDLGLASKKNIKIILTHDADSSQLEVSRKAQYGSYDGVVNKNRESNKSSQTSLPPLMIMVDRNRIVQVLDNLISNALWSVTSGYSEKIDRIIGSPAAEDEIARCIEVSTEKDVIVHNNVVVSVRDNGAGINQDLFPKLFTKFVTNDDRGLGLGLYICKGIVEAHGGTIWAEDNQHGKTNGGTGAVFRFTLPMQ